jgi:hypothetical protein
MDQSFFCVTHFALLSNTGMNLHKFHDFYLNLIKIENKIQMKSSDFYTLLKKVAKYIYKDIQENAFHILLIIKFG